MLPRVLLLLALLALAGCSGGLGTIKSRNALMGEACCLDALIAQWGYMTATKNN